jgi:hypothetical protein
MISLRQATITSHGPHLAECFKQSLLVACTLSAALIGGQAVQAGPTLETRESTAIGAQATFNNSWAQTFEAKGAMTVPGGGALIPFSQVTPLTPLVLPNSGLAELTATVSNMTVSGGTLDGSASVDPSSGPGTNGIVLNASGGNGLPALQITPGTADSSVIGASIIGTNIGTDTLQVTGSLNTTVINTLTAF